MIAMALACNPQLLIADEPTTALDVTIQAQILDLLRQLQEEFGMSIMIITHDLGIVAEMADDVAVMYASKVVEYAPVEELFRQSAASLHRGLVSVAPEMGKTREEASKSSPSPLVGEACREPSRTGRGEGVPASTTTTRLKTIPGMVPSPLHFPNGCKFHPRCSYNDAPLRQRRTRTARNKTRPLGPLPLRRAIGFCEAAAGVGRQSVVLSFRKHVRAESCLLEMMI